MNGPVVVGVDGSTESRAALEWAIELASAVEAPVVAVHAIGLLEPLGPDGRRIPAAGHIDEVRRIFAEEWCEPLRVSSLEHRTEIGFGPPAEVLLDAARQAQAGLIVVGSRGLGRAAPGVLGSSSARVARFAVVPVVIVPGPRAESTG